MLRRRSWLILALGPAAGLACAPGAQAPLSVTRADGRTLTSTRAEPETLP